VRAYESLSYLTLEHVKTKNKDSSAEDFSKEKIANLKEGIDITLKHEKMGPAEYKYIMRLQGI
jgi:hypothetical protein